MSKNVKWTYTFFTMPLHPCNQGRKPKAKASLIVHDWSPCLVRIKSVDRSRKLESIWTQVLLIDDSIVTNDKGLHTSDSVL